MENRDQTCPIFAKLQELEAPVGVVRWDNMGQFWARMGQTEVGDLLDQMRQHGCFASRAFGLNFLKTLRKRVEVVLREWTNKGSHWERGNSCSE